MALPGPLARPQPKEPWECIRQLRGLAKGAPCLWRLDGRSPPLEAGWGSPLCLLSVWDGIGPRPEWKARGCLPLPPSQLLSINVSSHNGFLCPSRKFFLTLTQKPRREGILSTLPSEFGEGSLSLRRLISLISKAKRQRQMAASAVAQQPGLSPARWSGARCLNGPPPAAFPGSQTGSGLESALTGDAGVRGRPQLPLSDALVSGRPSQSCRCPGRVA